MPFSYLKIFLLTQIIEVVIAKIFFKQRYIIPAVICLNFITHPLLHIILLSISQIWGNYFWPSVLVLELCVVIAEALLLKFASFDKPWQIAISINTASFLIGLIMDYAGIL
jgi:hypothetical protein